MALIDDWLSSEETGEPFSHCLRCKMPLVEIDAPWLVNKEIAGDECVMEYAICQPCRDQVTDGLSEESKESVREFLEQEIDWEGRMQDFMLATDLAERFTACIACRGPRELLSGYAISALFDSGGTVVAGPLPLLICRTCVGRMTKKLSDSTRRRWREFIEENFEGPGHSGFPGLL